MTLTPHEKDLIKQDSELCNIARDLLSNIHLASNKIKTILEQRCKNAQSANQLSDQIADQYVVMSKLFYQNGQAVQAAIDLLLHGSEQFSAWQAEHKIYVSRSTLFSQLTAYYLHVLNDIGAATWWALHTVTDTGNGNDGVDSVFISRLGYPKEVADRLRTERNKYNDKVDPKKLHESFTEDIIRNFFVKYPQYHYILGNNSQVAFFPLCKTYYGAFLDYINNLGQGVSSTERGKELELLATYLFLLIPGCSPRHDVKDQQKVHQTDLIILNRHPAVNLTTELFGRHIVVECKNWQEAVSVSEVGYFLHKLHLMHASCGVLLAKSGITGNKDDETGAKQLIRRSFHEDHTLCVVVTQNDLKRLRDENITFRDLLIQLTDEFRFGK